jgi:hypothetical protein
MTTLSFPHDDHCGPQPLMQPLDATPCRRALLANAGHVGPSPELIAFHRREAERLRQASFRRALRMTVKLIRKLAN